MTKPRIGAYKGEILCKAIQGGAFKNMTSARFAVRPQPSLWVRFLEWLGIITPRPSVVPLNAPDFVFRRWAPDPTLAPKVGDKWVFTDSDSPWPAKQYIPATILDCRDGWVRYDMGGSLFRDERMELKDFVRMYRRVDPAPPTPQEPQ